VRLNGSYTRDDHPDVPVTLDQLTAGAVACHAAGAGSVHLHPRRPDDGAETLGAAVHDAVVRAIREAAPQLEISCSTRRTSTSTAPAIGLRQWAPGATRPTSSR
jgi:uncharacterized protein (DUF849 family)